MNDAAIAFALIAVAVLGWPVALVTWLELRLAKKEIAGMNSVVDKAMILADRASQIIGEKEALKVRCAGLQRQLAQASKNDHRDAKGRFARAS